MILYGAAIFCETQELLAVAVMQPRETLEYNKHSRALSSKCFQDIPNRGRE
jgi:hypothetical protein